ncbi:MAG TPA: long-chain fatty acid--CoA ligase [Acidimicrobiales bacterium]|nr:long-chain fatty acid--CoA ligase [Acidimicrobiales bacterium]
MLTIATLLERQAARHASTVALVDEATDRSWTIRDLEVASRAVAHALADLGVAHGDRVGLLSANHPSIVPTYLAVARLGAVLVPVNARLTAPEIGAIAADAGISALVADRGLAEVATAVAGELQLPVERRLWIGDGDAPAEGRDLEPVIAATADPGPLQVAQPPVPEDLLYLMYTSGTTGRAKGAMHTHATTMAATSAVLEGMDYRPGDKYFNVMPLFHVASLAMVNICLARRCTMVLGRAFDPAGTWKTIADHRVDAMMAVPAMLQAMDATFDPSLDTSSLRVLSSGAAPVPLPLLERFHELGIDIVQAYGLTEAGGAVSVLDAADAVTHLGSAGKALLSLELRIEDEDGNELPPGEPGEIVVRGPSITTGYWQLPEVTAETIRDGWFHTGDVGVLDEEGFLTIRDRLKDMLISGGENVYPAEVESVLLGHPAVADVAVIGQPSPRWGESAVAVVVPGEGFDPDELIAWSRERLAGFKAPKAVVTVDALPRNASGKILKHELRDRFPGPAPE